MINYTSEEMLTALKELAKTSVVPYEDYWAKVGLMIEEEDKAFEEERKRLIPSYEMMHREFNI